MFYYNGALILVSANPDKFEKLSETHIFERTKLPDGKKSAPSYSYPAIANGKIYLRYLGKIVALSLK